MADKCTLPELRTVARGLKIDTAGSVSELRDRMLEKGEPRLLRKEFLRRQISDSKRRIADAELIMMREERILEPLLKEYYQDCDCCEYATIDGIMAAAICRSVCECHRLK